MDKEETKILTLGDGDFTYSLDLARHLATVSDFNTHLIATGIDTKEALFAKYIDSPHILNELLTAASASVKVSVRHAINAIVEKNDGGDISPVDHVIFNHPHLGTEDSVLHGRFICHLFHSCVHVWMKPAGGLLHLTLVEGQCERWGVLEAANRMNLVVIKRKTFQPPPIKNASYSLRRHQTGKSFASRRPKGSETIVFGRQSDHGLYVSTTMLDFKIATNTGTSSTDGLDQEIISKFPCPYCEKSFREERSLTCHVRGKHPEGSEKKAKTRNNSNPFQCSSCTTETGQPRVFSSEQALKDHMKAKHSAMHKTILPDWYKDSCEETKTEKEFGSCAICGIQYHSENHSKTHLDDFLPSAAVEKFECAFCTKRFRENRAKQQHENFCSFRESGRAFVEKQNHS